MTPEIDFDFLLETLAARFRLGEDSLHGPDHWRRVEQHGLRLDLPRVGIEPHRDFMSTPTGKNLAQWR